MSHWADWAQFAMPVTATIGYWIGRWTTRDRGGEHG